MVKDVVQRIRERHPLPNPYRVGDVCSILVKENPDLRGRGGCWALVTEVHQFSCTVQMWNGECQVRIENLKELPYSPAQREEVKKLCERLGFCRKIRYQPWNPTDNWGESEDYPRRLVSYFFAPPLGRISLDDLEKPVRDFLAGLGKLNRPWLTALEKKLLSVIEA